MTLIIPQSGNKKVRKTSNRKLGVRQWKKKLDVLREICINNSEAIDIINKLERALSTMEENLQEYESEPLP